MEEAEGAEIDGGGLAATAVGAGITADAVVVRGYRHRWAPGD